MEGIGKLSVGKVGRRRSDVGCIQEPKSPSHRNVINLQELPKHYIH